MYTIPGVNGRGSNIERYRSGNSTQGGGFNSLAAGQKRYGGGRSMPNIGPVADKLGYARRDRVQQAQQNLALQRMRFANSRRTEIM